MARTPRRRLAAPGETAPASPELAAPAAPGGGRPLRRVRDNLPRPAAAPVAAGVARPNVQRRRNPLSFLSRLQPRFLADVIAELRKVTWPSFAETRYLTLVVVVVAVAVGMFLGGVDLAFGWIIEKLFF